MSTPAPRRRPVVIALAFLCLLALAGAAAVLMQFFSVSQGWLAGPAWLKQASESATWGDSLGFTIAAGVGVLVGLLLMVWAFLPGKRSHQWSTGPLWVSDRALEAMAGDAADRCGEVLEADVHLTRGTMRVAIMAHPESSTSAVAQTVEESVSSRLAEVFSGPIRVTVKER